MAHSTIPFSLKLSGLSNFLVIPPSINLPSRVYPHPDELGLPWQYIPSGRKQIVITDWSQLSCPLTKVVVSINPIIIVSM